MISTNSFPESPLYTPSTVIKAPVTTPHRCSSPRQFFEKLYGHLETSGTSASSLSDVKIREPSIPSEHSSSPDFLDDR